MTNEILIQIYSGAIALFVIDVDAEIHVDVMTTLDHGRIDFSILCIARLAGERR